MTFSVSDLIAIAAAALAGALAIRSWMVARSTSYKVADLQEKFAAAREQRQYDLPYKLEQLNAIDAWLNQGMELAIKAKTIESGLPTEPYSEEYAEREQVALREFELQFRNWQITGTTLRSRAMQYDAMQQREPVSTRSMPSRLPDLVQQFLDLISYIGLAVLQPNIAQGWIDLDRPSKVRDTAHKAVERVRQWLIEGSLAPPQTLSKE